MKKFLFVLTLALVFSEKGFACDICGCGVGSYYLGIMPEFNKRFVGVRYQFKSIDTHLGPESEKTPLSNEEVYQTAELWGAWNFGKKWRTMAIIPYNINQREIPASGEKGKKHGLGDIVLMGYYKAFELKHTSAKNKMIVHSLWAGAGIKLPSGKYNDGDRTSFGENSPNNFQLGSASTDFLLNLAYDIRVMDGGLNTNLSYKINTENKYEYRYGNKFSANVLGYYKFAFDSSSFRIAPNLGAMIETQPKDIIFNRFDVAQSGGYTLSAVVGVEMNVKKISFGGNFQQPIFQSLADNRAHAGSRFMCHVSYSF